MTALNSTMKRTTLIAKLIATMFLALLALPALALTCTSIGSGLNWGTAGTWTSAGNCNRVPLATDDVIIANTHTITMNGNPGVALSLTINGIAAWTQNNRSTNVGTGGITINGDITGASTGNVLSTTGTLTLNNVTLTSNTVTLTTQTTAGININGTGSVALLAINSATTNNGTLTVRTTLSGSNTLTNAGTATLNIGGTSTVTGLAANAVGNLVNYTGAAQTVKLPTAGYYDLTLSGSGAKTMPGSALAVGRNLTTSGTATATTAGNLTVGGNLVVGSGTTFTSANFTTAVTGTTSVSGTLAHSGAALKTYSGLVTINSGAPVGSLTNAGNAAITYGGGLANNGSFASGTGVQTFTNGGITHNGTTFTAGSGAFTFTTNAQALNCASGMSIPTITVTTIAVSNNCNLTVTTALGGTGSFINAATGQLHVNFTGAIGIATLTASAVGNLVDYGFAGAQTIYATPYYNLTFSTSGAKTMPATALAVNGDFTTSGTVTATTASNLTVGGNLSVGSGTTLTVGAFTINVTGTTAVAGTLTHSSATGTKTYSGNVTVASGGIFRETAAAALVFGGDVTINNGGTLTEFGAATVSIAGNLQNDGTLTASTGLHTFTGVGKALSGATLISIPSVTVSGTYTNNGTLTVGTALAGGGILTNAASRTLNIGGTSAITTLTATASGNIVNYTGAGQTVNATAYDTLNITGTAANSGTVTVSTALGGAGTLTNAATGVLNIAGTSLITGLTATAVGNTVVYTGTGQTIKATTYHHLTLGGGTESISADTTVNGTLALGANTLTTGANTLIVSANCTAGNITRSSGYVSGNLSLNFPITVTTSTCIYHVGDGTGYAPMTITVGATTGGTLTGRVDAGDDPDTSSGASGIDPLKSANHYWTLTAGLVTPLSSAVSYSATFQFCANTASCAIPSEVDTGATTSNFVVARKLASIWATLTTGTQLSYSTQATGITSFGEFAVGEINICFTDVFTGADGSSPGSNWSVGNKTGTFGNPVIFGNRLRLTDATTGAATWATLQRPFPAAGNKVTVEFQHFAYGGSTPGADGLTVILSDASVAPTAGAFGGSLGYAQKSNPGSDCVTPGGCPGFTGGWLGVGLDEYGNYSTNAEGRYNGSPTRIANSVALRGSGSGMSGYRFLQGTSTLSPAIDGNGAASPPHQYRVIVDHSDSIHAWTSVERDTTGAGTAYTTLIGCAPGQVSGCTALDVKDPGYSQNAVPAYFTLSFAGSTGTSTNIHEVDNLKVCTVQGLAAPTLHHIELDHGGTACTTGPATVTVKACANAACSTLYMNSVTVDLTNIAGATWSTDPVTFTGGQTTVTLSDATARSDTLGATATSPTTGNATQCFNGATQTCTLTFSVCSFDVIEVGAAAGGDIYTKLANVAFNLDVLGLFVAGSQTPTAIQLVNSSNGTCGTYPVLANTSTALGTFKATPPPSTLRQTYAFTYNNSAPNVRVRVTTAGPVYSCSTDNFAIRPQAYTVTSTANNASPPPGGTLGVTILRAGTDGFPVTATAVYGATTTTAYTGLPKLNASLVTSGQANLGTLSNVVFPAATAGISTASGFKYSEVGNISLGQYAIYDDTFAQVDSVKGHCTSGFSNTLDANGKYSCQFGSAAAGPFGRFVPDHFTVVGAIANACTAGTFTYMDQPFTLSAANIGEARNASNGVTANYAGAYAPGTIGFGAENADNGTDLSARLTFPSGTWTAGVYTLTSTSASFSRPVTTVSDATWGTFDALDIGLTVTDGDVSTVPKVSSADLNPSAAGCGAGCLYKKFSGSPLRMRFGRLRLISGQGSDLAPFIMQTEAQYWDGSYWRTNTDDSCTSYATGNCAVSGTTGTTVSTANVIKNGYGSLLLTKPTSSGTATICLDMAATADGCTATAATLDYLRGNWSGPAFTFDPSATVLFGGANSNSRGNWGFLYRRENF